MSPEPKWDVTAKHVFMPGTTFEKDPTITVMDNSQSAWLFMEVKTNMHRKSGIFFIILGVVLIISALSLFLYNSYEDKKAGEASKAILSDIQHVINENVLDSIKQPEEADINKNLNPELPIVEMNGYEYVGYISIPDLEIELPVMSDWDYERLEIAPCRQFGSSRTDDLVIAAHNHVNHFGYLYKLGEGASIYFTDMEGIKNEYEITLIDTLSPTEVEAVQNSGHDLVLYTCTYEGVARVTVFCDRLD